MKFYVGHMSKDFAKRSRRSALFFRKLGECTIDVGFRLCDWTDGPVTYKNAKRPKEVARKISLDKLLLETDAPYLTPEPKRGKRNESAYLSYIGQEIATLRSEELKIIAEQTTANGKRVFNIK